MRNRQSLFWTALLLWGVFGQIQAAVAVTPSHVFQQAQDLLRLTEALRKHEGVDAAYRQPGVQFAKTPIHALAKSLEVREKLIQLQEQYGVAPLAVKSLPVRNIVPADVLASLQESYGALQQVARQRGLSQLPQSAPFEKGKSPSQVYEEIWKASNAFDALSGKISPSKVFRNTEQILDELRLLADNLDVELDTELPPLPSGKTPKHVNVVAFKNLHLLVKLQKRMKMKRAYVASFPEGRITPAEVFDTTNNLKAELIRIKLNLGITTPHRAFPLVDGKSPNHVFQNMQLIRKQVAQVVGAERFDAWIQDTQGK